MLRKSTRHHRTMRHLALPASGGTGIVESEPVVAAIA